MSHSNTTPNWGVPQFTSNDVPSWLSDVNQIGQKVEQGLNAVKIIGQDANTAASGAQATANALTPRVAANEQGIEGLQTVVGGLDMQVDGLDTRVTNLENSGDVWEDITASGLPTELNVKALLNRKARIVSVYIYGRLPKTPTNFTIADIPSDFSIAYPTGQFNAIRGSYTGKLMQGDGVQTESVCTVSWTIYSGGIFLNPAYISGQSTSTYDTFLVDGSIYTYLP